MKKFKKTLRKIPKRIVAIILVAALILNYFIPITKVFAQGMEVEIDFTDGTINGNVITYNVDNIDVTATLDGNYTLTDGKINIDSEEWLSAITIDDSYDVDSMQIRIYAEDGFSTTYSYNAGTLSRNGDGGLPESFKFVIEPKGSNQPSSDSREIFDGRAVVLWSCGSNDSKVCYHEFDVIDPEHCDPEHPSEACDPEIGNFDDGNSTFFKDTNIEADNNPGEKFNVDARYREWYLTDEFHDWLNLYHEAYGDDVNWDTLDPELIMGEPNQNIEQLEQDASLTCGARPEDDADNEDKDEYEDCIHLYAAQVQHKIWTHELQPVGEPDAKNAYVSYGDRNFKVVIYNSDYRGITTGDLDGLTYYPSSWADPYLRTDQYDISESTKTKPALLDSILLENTVNINALGYNGFEIASITPLDVPEDAVTVSKIGNKYSVVFTSHFYDNVVFKVKDTDNLEYYIKIKRYTIDAWFDHDNLGDFLRADFYYAKNKSYTDFDITAKILYKNGTTKMVNLTPQANVDDGLGNFTDNYYIDQEYPDSNMDPDHDEPIGKGLKLSTFRYVLQNGEKDTIQDIYMNAEYKGNDPDVYPGAYSGSGEGTLANIFHPEEVNQ